MTGRRLTCAPGVTEYTLESFHAGQRGSFLCVSGCGVPALLGRRRVAPAPAGGAGGGQSLLPGPLQPGLSGAAPGGKRGLFRWPWIGAVPAEDHPPAAPVHFAGRQLGPARGTQAAPAPDCGALRLALHAEPFVLLLAVAYLYHRSLLRRDAAHAELPGLSGLRPVFPFDDGRADSAPGQAARPALTTLRLQRRGWRARHAADLRGPGEEAADRRLPGQQSGEPRLRYPRALFQRGDPGCRLRLCTATVLRLQRLHGYCQGRGAAAGHPAAGELPPAVPRGERGRVLAALAHHLLRVAARLPLRRAAQAAQASAALLQLCLPGHIYPGRPVARALLDLPHLGLAARAGVGRGLCLEAPAQVAVALLVGQIAGGLGDLPLCLLHLDILPRHLA